MRKVSAIVFPLVFAVLFVVLGNIYIGNKNLSSEDNVARKGGIGKMKITSPVFDNNSMIINTYTCDGENINPPFKISDTPENTKSLVLIMDDPDAPMGTFVHWVLFNIPPQTREIMENSVPIGAVSGVNSTGKAGYTSPCPPSGTHRYFFKLYALDEMLNLSQEATKEDVLKAMEGHILDQAVIIGLYGRGT